MKKLTYKQLATMSPEEIGKLNKTQMVGLLKQARSKYETRAKSFAKQGKNFYSPAQEKIEAYYDENGKIAPSKVSRNRAMNEIFVIQDFFRAKTGTVAGARQVMREQDARIFGVSAKTGSPKHRLSREQRTRFWEVYEEFINQHKTAIAEFTSGKIQQYLGERVISEKGRKLSVDMDTIDSIWDELHSRKFTEDDIDAGRNIFTGRRNNRNR